MNPYEESMLEGQDLVCVICWRALSVQEYYDNEGYCNQCIEEMSEEE